MSETNTALALLRLLKELHTDGVLVEAYGFSPEVVHGESAPLECAMIEWEAAGFPLPSASLEAKAAGCDLLIASLRLHEAALRHGNDSGEADTARDEMEEWWPMATDESRAAATTICALCNAVDDPKLLVIWEAGLSGQRARIKDLEDEGSQMWHESAAAAGLETEPTPPDWHTVVDTIADIRRERDALLVVADGDDHE